jgi:diguanylate cyclase (GGDEF)-like protein
MSGEFLPVTRDLPTDPNKFGEFFDSLSPEFQREIAISLRVGNIALIKALGIDSKTGLLRHDRFEELVSQEIAPPNNRRQKEKQRTHGLILADLDDFKRLNEQIGYNKTDELALIPAAHTIRENIRHDEDLAARWGGEEFVIFLPDTDIDGVLVVSEKIQNAVNSLEPIKGEPLGISMAYAGFLQGTEYNQIFNAANESLTGAKKIIGKNKIVPVGNGD